MDGLDVLGAIDAFANQLIVIRVKSIDADKLKNKLGGTKGATVSAALPLASLAPKAVFDIALPVALGTMKNYGIEAEATVSNAPLASFKKRGLSEFFPGLILGGILGGTGFGVVKLVGKLFR